jgi:hypothetical protein
MNNAAGYSTEDHERLLIHGFFLPQRRDRFLSLLKNSAGRKKFRLALPHFKAIDPRYSHKIPTRLQSSWGIFSLLKAKGAPEQCHILSENTALDGKQMKLSKALEAVIGYGMGTFISCIPGRLAYYESETPGERYVLERQDSLLQP